MVVISGQGVVQDIGTGHLGFGFEEGTSFWSEFRYEKPFSSFPTGSVGLFRGFVAAEVDIDGVHFSSSRLGSEIHVADSAVKRFRLNALNMVQAPTGFPALDMLMFEVRGGDIFNVHDFPTTTSDLHFNAATSVKIELKGSEKTVLSLDPQTVTIAVVPEPAAGLLWLLFVAGLARVRFAPA
jgi:hypothetical protein